MRNTFLQTLKVLICLSFSSVSFSQKPDLGTASTFALFTAAGAFANDGTSFITGDIGTNVGEFTGFPPGIVIGQIHVADPASAQAATDVLVAYSYLSGITCGQVIGTTLGNNQVLGPDVYCLGAASTLNGDLVLDGQGDPNALFIFKIDGALATSTFANVVLINSASLCNVYWQVNGAFALGEGSVFRGTLLINGAIALNNLSTLFGRALST
ncbi:MAG: ice-binding family protein, partial [Ferruginibacter sp.]